MAFGSAASDGERTMRSSQSTNTLACIQSFVFSCAMIFAPRLPSRSFAPV